MSDEIIDLEPVNVAALTRRDNQPPALTQPVASQADILAAFHAYQQTREALLQDADYQEFWEKGKTSRFVKRSGWRKLAIAYSVAFEIRERIILRDEHGQVYDAEFVVRATAPNGRYADGWGACSGFERCCQPGCTRDRYRGKPTSHKHCPAASGEVCTPASHFSKPRHDIPATAETRAKNRAAADLFGMGEVSAEEMSRSHDEEHAELKVTYGSGEKPDVPADAWPVDPLPPTGQTPEQAREEAEAHVGCGVDARTVDSIAHSMTRLFQLMSGAGLWPVDAYQQALTAAQVTDLHKFGKKPDLLRWAENLYGKAAAKLGEL